MTGYDATIFDAIPILPIPILAQLRDVVLAHSTKRSPKWKFRLAADLVIELQPKPSTSGRRWSGSRRCSQRSGG